MIKLLIGGSPCTFWSVSGGQLDTHEMKAEGLGWELFRNYLIAKEKFKPDFFLYENNKSAAQEIKSQISRELGADLMYINSALVSAQERERFYCFNWEVEQPTDRRIYLDSILYDHEYKPRDFSKYKNTIRWDSAGEVISWDTSGKGWYSQQNRARIPSAAKINAVPSSGDDKNNIYLGNYKCRKIHPIEAERLQTLPDNYTATIKRKSKRVEMCGNGWTAEIIIHILNGVLKDVPRDEEIVVLSMYDGIGTGRYCLDKMGFTNVKYFAYEIDRDAMAVSLSNYPDIVQKGDAFGVRHPDWTIGY